MPNHFSIGAGALCFAGSEVNGHLQFSSHLAHCGMLLAWRVNQDSPLPFLSLIFLLESVSFVACEWCDSECASHPICALRTCWLPRAQAHFLLASPRANLAMTSRTNRLSSKSLCPKPAGSTYPSLKLVGLAQNWGPCVRLDSLLKPTKRETPKERRTHIHEKSLRKMAQMGSFDALYRQHSPQNNQPMPLSCFPPLAVSSLHFGISLASSQPMSYGMISSSSPCTTKVEAVMSLALPALSKWSSSRAGASRSTGAKKG